jgi:hypothetical protein
MRRRPEKLIAQAGPLLLGLLTCRQFTAKPTIHKHVVTCQPFTINALLSTGRGALITIGAAWSNHAQLTAGARAWALDAGDRRQNELHQPPAAVSHPDPAHYGVRDPDVVRAVLMHSRELNRPEPPRGLTFA